MRVEPVLNIDGLKFTFHSPWPHTRDDPSRQGAQWKVQVDARQPLPTKVAVVGFPLPHFPEEWLPSLLALQVLERQCGASSSSSDKGPALDGEFGMAAPDLQARSTDEGQHGRNQASPWTTATPEIIQNQPSIICHQGPPSQEVSHNVRVSMGRIQVDDVESNIQCAEHLAWCGAMWGALGWCGGVEWCGAVLCCVLHTGIASREGCVPKRPQ